MGDEEWRLGVGGWGLERGMRVGRKRRKGRKPMGMSTRNDEEKEEEEEEEEEEEVKEDEKERNEVRGEDSSSIHSVASQDGQDLLVAEPNNAISMGTWDSNDS
uniref:Uncharacterized protein n=1 Tax=Vespula pensylvanica TaxID=30213 RepID=A0A834UGT2_VESPE|nr:hypothetical protein H0235_000889 [Vespula pensylvanica]